MNNPADGASPRVTLTPIELRVRPGGLLRREEAALYLDLAPRTLANLAHQKLGPRFFLARRRAYYRVEDLDHWRAEQFNRRRRPS
jgi:Helix-turn-helix domain